MESKSDKELRDELISELIGTATGNIFQWAELDIPEAEMEMAVILDRYDITLKAI